MIKSCIQNRAQIHVEAARDEYERARQRMGQQRSEKPLQVFSVSADIFTRLNKGRGKDALRKGFSTKAETGIPALRDALIEMTWGIRQRNARSFNEDTESFLKRMKLWAADNSSEYKMLDYEKAIVQNRMNAEIKKLDQVCYISQKFNMNCMFECYSDEMCEGILQVPYWKAQGSQQAY